MRILIKYFPNTVAPRGHDYYPFVIQAMDPTGESKNLISRKVV